MGEFPWDLKGDNKSSIGNVRLQHTLLMKSVKVCIR